MNEYKGIYTGPGEDKTIQNLKIVLRKDVRLVDAIVIWINAEDQSPEELQMEKLLVKTRKLSKQEVMSAIAYVANKMQ